MKVDTDLIYIFIKSSPELILALIVVEEELTFAIIHGCSKD